MTLRAGISIGYGYLVALLLLIAVSATVGFLSLSAGIDEVLEENFKTIGAASEMIEALERQDSLVLEMLSLERDSRAAAGVDLERWRQTVSSALAVAQGNITEEGETELVERIGREIEVHRAAVDRVLAEDGDLERFRAEVQPAFDRLSGTTRELSALNRQAMLRAGRQAREKGRRNGAWLGFAAALALVSLVILTHRLQHRLLGRLDTLTESLEAMASGDHERRFRIDGTDELSRIAEGCNRLAASAQEAQRQAAARASLERRIIHALTEKNPEACWLLSPEGGVMAGSESLPAEVREWLGDKQALVREPGRDAQELEIPGGYRAVPLHFRGRVVGWQLFRGEPAELTSSALR